MSRNRRNKRGFKKITDIMSLKTFFTLFTILMLIIIGCIASIFYRNYKDKEIVAKQRENLDKDIEAIFAETIQNIADSNNSKRDSIIRISAVGDILCGDEMLEDAYQKEYDIYNFDAMFQNITSLTKGRDIVLGTMESNFTSNKYSGYGKRNSPIAFAKAIRNTGVNLVSISTNHSLDYGINGLLETKEQLKELGYSTVGDCLGENNVTIKEVKGAKIAFISYTYGVEGQSGKTKEELASVNIFSEEKAIKDIEFANENSDYIIAIMHWGEDYATEPSKKQKKIADFLVENGVDMILGNHPAVIQPMEIRKNAEGNNVLIAYSLGNYSSSISNETSKVELILNIELRKKGEDGTVALSKVEYVPIYVLDNGTKAQNRYQLIDMKGVAKAYANGNTNIISKKTYTKLLKGLDLLEKIIVDVEN